MDPSVVPSALVDASDRPADPLLDDLLEHWGVLTTADRETVRDLVRRLAGTRPPENH